MTKMAKKLSQNFNVEIICGPIPKVIDSIYYSKEKITLDHFTIFRGPSPSWSKNNLFRRIVKQLLMSISLMVILFKRLDKNTIVLSVTNPPTLPVCLAILRSVKALIFGCLFTMFFQTML